MESNEDTSQQEALQAKLAAVVKQSVQAETQRCANIVTGIYSSTDSHEAHQALTAALNMIANVNMTVTQLNAQVEYSDEALIKRLRAQYDGATAS